MEQYTNRDGGSGIAAYEIGDDSIIVQFNDGAAYLYTSQSAGAAALAEMQRLARAGQGLNSYIKRVVRKGYARRLR